LFEQARQFLLAWFERAATAALVERVDSGRYGENHPGLEKSCPGPSSVSNDDEERAQDDRPKVPPENIVEQVNLLFDLRAFGPDDLGHWAIRGRGVVSGAGPAQAPVDVGAAGHDDQGAGADPPGRVPEQPAEEEKDRERGDRLQQIAAPDPPVEGLGLLLDDAQNVGIGQRLCRHRRGVRVVFGRPKLFRVVEIHAGVSSSQEASLFLIRCSFTPT
jgi:hypothetical protein